MKFMLCLDNNTAQNPNQGRSSEDQQFDLPRYSAYEIDYSRGYNKGDANFVNIVPGRYILKIKIEKNGMNSNYVINYASNNNFQMK